jgi:alanine racemase
LLSINTEASLNSHGANRHPRAIIDLEALKNNYRYLKQQAGGNRLIAVVKADAYGHGVTEITHALPDADAFAVATVGEAVALREAGIKQKLLVMGGFIRTDELQVCIDYTIDPVLHHQFHLDCLCTHPNLNDLDVWLKIDSGMGRLGFPLQSVPGVIDCLVELDTLGSLRMMTHLASADDADNAYTKVQLENVKSLGLDEYEWGIANSAGVLAWPGTHHLWARAGIALYGVDPVSDNKTAQRNLQPVMTMKSSVIAVNHHSRGDVIGYANTYTCPQDMTIAVVAAGYADGYPRHKIDTAQVEIHGQLCDIVGRVSMDMITVDVSQLDEVKLDAEATLFGASPRVNSVAECSQTIAYEILCNVGAHVQREYVS